MTGDGGHPHPLKEAQWHGGGLDVATLQMAFLWAAEEGFFFFQEGKPPPALYHLEPK